MCLSRDWKNSYNFIRWKSATTLAIADVGTATTCDDAITSFPNHYLKNCKEYYPNFILASELSIYANLNTPDDSADFSAWRVRLYDWYGDNSSLADFAPTKDIVSGTDFNFYFTLTPTTSNFTANKLYRFVIYENSGNTVKYVSNWFWMRGAADAYKYANLSYRNSNSLFNFNFSVLTSFRNKVAVDLNLVDHQPEVEFEQYNEASTGKVRNSKTYSKEALTFEGHFLDLEADRAMLCLSACDDILMNSNVLEVKEAYKVTPNVNNNTHKGSITFYNQAVSTINLNGYIA